MTQSPWDISRCAVKINRRTLVTCFLAPVFKMLHMLGQNHLPNKNIKITFLDIQGGERKIQIALKDEPAVQKGINTTPDARCFSIAM